MRAAALCFALAGCAVSRASPHAIELETAGQRLIVRTGGAPFAEYHYEHAPRPILYPLLAPGTLAVTRAWPQEERQGEPHDHPHHQSLWFGHGNVNGHDFWTCANGERVVHTGGAQRALEDGAMEVFDVFLWQLADGRTLCREHRRMRFSADADARRVDFTLELSPAREPLVFGDTKEGTFALRLAPSLALSGEGAQGQALNSAGDRDGACWGKRASWVAYWGPVAGGTACVALLEHPSSFRHPTWWHARDYGLLAANPFGAHDFEGTPPGTGDFRLAPGQTLTLRYRLLLRAEPADAAWLEWEFERYASEGD